MPYTYKSLAFVWLLITGLFILSMSGAVGGWWVAVLVALALGAPSLMLRAPAAAVRTVSAGAPGSSTARIDSIAPSNAYVER